jgi:DNA-binding beta-propeller fold protein YncE
MSRDPFRISRTIDIPSCPAIWLELDHPTQSLIVVCEGGDKVVWIDYQSWQTTATLRLPRTTWPHAAVVDSEQRKIYVCAGSMSRYLYEIDADKHTIIRRAPVGYVTLGMSYDPPTGRLFLSKSISSKILIFDTHRMKTTGYIKTMPGVRDISVDYKRRMLYAGNYIPGVVQTFNIDGDIRARSVAYVSKQVRGIFHDIYTNRTYAASSCGIIKLEK